jgi:hypothetical protein
VTGQEFSTAVEEINGGDPTRRRCVFSSETKQEPHRAETAMDDPAQDGYLEDSHDREHVEDLN